MRIDTTWDSAWTDFQGTLAGRVQIGTLSRGVFVVYGIGTDGRIKLKWFDGVGTFQPTGSAWTDTLGGTFTGGARGDPFRGFCITLMAVTTGGRSPAQHVRRSELGGWTTRASNARPKPGPVRDLEPLSRASRMGAERSRH